MLKTFLNNKKIPCSPPLLHDDKFIKNFLKRLKYFFFFCETMFCYKQTVFFLQFFQIKQINYCQQFTSPVIIEKFQKSLKILDRNVSTSNLSAFFWEVWLLNIVPYVSESRKLPAPSRTFGLGGCDVIITSL